MTTLVLPLHQVATSHSGERRQVTALFCDMVDSVAMTVRLGPEDMMSVVAAYLDTCERVIAAHGGTIVQYMGDGVLAYFGVPRAGEDDAARAVRAGLALRDAVTRLEMAAAPLQLRVGIATGLVVVGELSAAGGLRASIVGETPNLAARLLGVAAPDSVVVSHTTQRITSGAVAYRTMGCHKLKGFAGLIEVFEALEPAPVAIRPQSGAPLVGRQPELAQLLAGWFAAQAGSGQAVLLQGEPGIGKSRLVAELRRHAASAGGAQVAWYCGPTHGDTALQPVAYQVARAAGFQRGDTRQARRERLDRLLDDHALHSPVARSELARLLGVGEAAEPGQTPEWHRARLLGGLLELLRQHPGGRQLLLVLEDAQWSDSTTLDLLDQIVAAAAGQGWLVVVTARPDFAPPWLGQQHVTHLQLARLAGTDAERICAYLDPAASLPAPVVRQILQRCDGIPLFVEEMTKSVLEAMQAAPALAAPDLVRVPDTLQDSLMARLDRLGPARRVACLAAAIGRRFSYGLLAEVSGLAAAELDQALATLVHSGLVDGVGPGLSSAYQFKHALIRDAAYESLLTRERASLHGRIAAALREQFPETVQVEPALLAYHLAASGAASEAIPLWAHAGERAAASAAHVEAVAHFQSALSLLRGLPDPAPLAATELQLLLGLAVSLAASRGYSAPELGAVLAEARAICDALGNVGGLFAVLRGICSFFIVSSQLDAAEDMARRCLAIAARTGQPEHAIEADYAFGYIKFSRGELATARTHLERAVALYDAHDGAQLRFPSPQDPLVGSLSALVYVLHAQGEDAAAADADQALGVHMAGLDRSFDPVYGLCFRASHELTLENYPRALTFAEAALALCETHHYRLWGAFAGFYRSVARAHLGERDRGLATALDYVAELDRVGACNFRSFCLAEIACLHMLVGDRDAALATIDAAIADACRSGEHYYLSTLHRRRARMLDGEAAQAALRQAVEVAREQGAAGFEAMAKQASSSFLKKRTKKLLSPG